MSESRSEIKEESIKIIKEAGSKGIRYSILATKLIEVLPHKPSNTIRSAITNIYNFDKFNEEICKPERGLFMHIKYIEKDEVKIESITIDTSIKEEDFYESFANWLMRDLEGCSMAIPLGKNYFRDRWGTPDVIGKLEPSKSDIIKYEPQITSAEIKLDRGEYMKAFGQAVVYKQFSHKVFLVIPKNSSQDVISRMDSLCLIEGLGLVLYDSENVEEPQYEIRSRPKLNIPDMFYTNKYLKLIEKKLF